MKNLELKNGIKKLTEFLDTYDVYYKVVENSVVAEEVYLGTRGITQLPDSIGYLICNDLDLSNNNLTSLPDSIGNIQCDNLYLYDNELTSLPDSIGDIQCENLYLQDNQLTSESKQLLHILESAGVNVIY